MPESEWKKQQQALAQEYRDRGSVIWTSCMLVNIGTKEKPVLSKVRVQGTYTRPGGRRDHTGRARMGKAARKQFRQTQRGEHVRV